MKVFLLLLALVVASLASAATNLVTLAWNDTNNYRGPIVVPGDLTIVLPAVTQITYRVYFATNLLTNTLWQPFTNVSATNPGTNDIKATFAAPPVTTFYTVTAIDPLGLESDFSNLTGVSRPSPVKTGIRLSP